MAHPGSNLLGDCSKNIFRKTTIFRKRVKGLEMNEDAEALLKKVRAVVLSPSDVVYNNWANEEARWVANIGTSLSAVVVDTLKTLDVIRGEHDKLENMIEEWARKEKARQEQEEAELQRRRAENDDGPPHAVEFGRRLRAGPLRMYNEDGDVVDTGPVVGSKIRAAFHEELGTQFFHPAYVGTLSTGHHTLGVKMQILPDILIPEDAETATIDYIYDGHFDDAPESSMLLANVRVEIALGVKMFQSLARGGDRFLSVVTQRVIEHVQQQCAQSVHFGESANSADKQRRGFTRCFAIGIRFPPVRRKMHINQFMLGGAEWMRYIAANHVQGIVPYGNNN
jgi:hypothetical protein